MQQSAAISPCDSFSNDGIIENVLTVQYAHTKEFKQKNSTNLLTNDDTFRNVG